MYRQWSKILTETFLIFPIYFSYKTTIFQYTYIVSNNKIYLYELQKQVDKRSFGELFWFVSQRVQINFIFTDNVRCCVYSQMPEKVQNKSRNNACSNWLQCCPLSRPHLYCCHFFPLLYMNQVPESFIRFMACTK